MSITRTEAFPCPCGAMLVVELCDSLNAGRHPHLRKAVLDRELHAKRCDACTRTLVIEHRFLYVDLERKQVLGVFSRGERDDPNPCAQQLEETFERWFRRDAPASVQRIAEQCLVRVCFGLEELREKLVADDAGISDYALEALKCVVLGQDPRFRDGLVSTLRLERADAATLDLLTVDFHDRPLGDVVRVPREELDQLPLAAMRAAFPMLAVGPHVSVLRLGLR